MSEAKSLGAPPIAVSLGEWEIVAAILRKHLAGRAVWAFGSRSTGRLLKRFSDLDLLIDGPALTLLEMALLREAFDESRLPFKVDVIELRGISEEFRERIWDEKALLTIP